MTGVARRTVASPQLETERTTLRIGREDDAPALVAYIERNRSHHQRWEPRAHSSYRTVETQRRVLVRRAYDFEQGTAACFLLFERGADGGTIIGRANFTELVRGPFQACFLGYSIDGAFEGKGYMSEALRAAIAWTFEELRLHRIMANYRPENERSGRLLERLGFVREGFAKDYLFIDGAWADHVLTALTNPHPERVALP
jgi:ribosomal-protein-alanine N-acetyltransferase